MLAPKQVSTAWFIQHSRSSTTTGIRELNHLFKFVCFFDRESQL